VRGAGSLGKVRSRCAKSALALIVMTVSACSESAPQQPTVATPSHSSTAELPCDAALTTGPLPEWARDGFTPPDQSVPQVRGARGEILGVVFGDPLRAPSVAGHGNKILWLTSPTTRTASPHTTEDPALKIHATLNGSQMVADRVVAGGPGPSLVDMPAPGCWTFTLTWSGRVDQLAVPYW
jgi:hypothetical protein